MSRRRNNLALAVIEPTSEVVTLRPVAPSLTPKQMKFARLYVQLGNASEAYRRAYDVSPDTKAETVNVNAAQLAATTKIAQRIAEIEAEALSASQLSLDRLISETFKTLDNARAQQDSRAEIAAIAALERLYDRLAPEALKAGAPESLSTSQAWLESVLAGKTIDGPPSETRDEWMLRRAREGNAKVPDAQLLAMAAGDKNPEQWLLEMAHAATPGGKAEAHARCQELLAKLCQPEAGSEFPVLAQIAAQKTPL